MKVLIAASECIPYAKTGGLADVIGALLRALRSLDVDARVIMPLYRGIKTRFGPKPTGDTVSIPLGNKVYQGNLFALNDEALFVECPEFFDRKELYGTALGEFEDNAFRYVFFSRAVLSFCSLLQYRPDIVHANDWQAALVPLYMKTLYSKAFGNIPSLFTIHNLGYQGIYPASSMTLTGLPQDFFSPRLLEFYGLVNFMKAGIISADAVTTVSPRYASETLMPEYGFGLEGVLAEKGKAYKGILNGVDYSSWNPSDDALLQATYDRNSLQGKQLCKMSLVEQCGFSNPEAPVIGMVGRLAAQKGIDLFMEAAPELFSNGLNAVILGRGDTVIQDDLKRLAREFPGQFSLNLKFNEEFAHLIYAGSDMLMMPSRYEPCGLSQLIAMRYGTVPVARATGGLVDTVDDYDHLKKKGSGFLFTGFHPSAFVECMKRALSVYTSKRQWTLLVKECMGKDYSWENSASEYLNMYQKLVQSENK